jgi:hypothetical protein
MTKEVMREALTRIAEGNLGEAPWQANYTAIKRIATEALAQPEQEPVAIALNTGTKQGVKWLKNVEHGERLYTAPPQPEQEPESECNPHDICAGCRCKYAAQPEQPAQRKPLTDEEIERACVPLGAAMLSFTEVARAIEAAHGIGEKPDAA